MNPSIQKIHIGHSSAFDKHQKYQAKPGWRKPVHPNPSRVSHALSIPLTQVEIRQGALGEPDILYDMSHLLARLGLSVATTFLLLFL